MPEDDISPEGCDLLRRMININARERISIEDIKNHDWFKINLPDDFETRWNYKSERIDDRQASELSFHNWVDCATHLLEYPEAQWENCGLALIALDLLLILFAFAEGSWNRVFGEKSKNHVRFWESNRGDGEQSKHRE